MNPRRIRVAPNTVVNATPRAARDVPERCPKNLRRCQRVMDGVENRFDKPQRGKLLQFGCEEAAHFFRKLGFLDLKRRQGHDVWIVVGRWQGDAQELRQPGEHDHWRATPAPILHECKPRAVNVVKQAHRHVVLRHLYPARRWRPADTSGQLGFAAAPANGLCWRLMHRTPTAVLCAWRDDLESSKEPQIPLRKWLRFDFVNGCGYSRVT